MPTALPTAPARFDLYTVIGCAAILVLLIPLALAGGMLASRLGLIRPGGSPTPSVVAAVSSGPTARPPTPTPAQPTSAQPTSAFATFGDGQFIVGQDVTPGTYRTRAASSLCYWARLSGFSGELADIIASDLTNYPSVVTIAASDKGFKSDGCGTWTSDLSQITSSQTAFTDGMLIIGTDIAAGTYKSTARSLCYWARLSGFGGTLNEIIASDLTNSAAVVTIAAGDKGFKSDGCGPWTRTG